MAADWTGGVEPNDPVLVGKKPPKDEPALQIPSRNVGRKIFMFRRP